MTPAPYRTVTRRLRVFAEDSWRQQISEPGQGAQPGRDGEAIAGLHDGGHAARLRR